MTDDNFTEIEMEEILLTPEDTLNPALQTPLSQTEFGGEGEIDRHNIELRIGRRPIVRSLRELYEKAHKELPPDLQVFSSFRLRMIIHVISAVRERGVKRHQPPEL